MSTKKFPSELSLRGTVLVTDKLLIHNITSGATEYTTVAELQASLSTFAAGQIGFPATQVPSAGVNVFDDYEEGTFTPVLAFGGAASGTTYTTQQGVYTKIGNLVTIIIRITLSSKGSSTGDATITGLPFTASAYSPCSLWMDIVSFADFPFAAVIGVSVQLKEITNAGVRTGLADTNFANNSTIAVNCGYTV